MNAFLKKDILVYWRDRKEILTAIIVPLILIIVLGLVFPGWIENPASALQVKAAYVVHDDEEAGLRQFQAALDAINMDAEEARALAELAGQKSPAKLLHDIFASEQVADMITMTAMNAEEAQDLLQRKEVHAIVVLPADFTWNALNKMLLNDGDGASINLVADEPSIEVGVLQGIIDGFLQHFNASSAIAHALSDAQGTAELNTAIPTVGGLERIEGVRALSSFQYFTLAITVLFSIYIATTTASKAVTEKREHVFERILLSDSRPLAYLAGKMGSTLIISLLQLSLVIMVCHFMLGLFPGYSLQFWLGFCLLTAMIGLFIASISGLFTAIMFRLNPDTSNAVIHSLILVIGIIGGNFVPVYVLPEGIKQFWEWTPNGLWLSTMIQWIQQESWATMSKGLLGLAMFTLAATAASVAIFPRRRRG